MEDFNNPIILTIEEFLYGVANKTFRNKDGFGIFLKNDFSEVDPSIAKVSCDFSYMLNYLKEYPYILWTNY